MNSHLTVSLRRAVGAALAAALALVGCGTTAPGSPITSPVPGQLSKAVPEADGPHAIPRPSNAGTERAYRQDAARHIYAVNAGRIYSGKLPPLLYAVGTLQVRLDENGRVTSMNWMRAPRHAPEVIAEIERTVLAASPYPAAARLGKLTWTDTWLWDKGGHFQLDTLSEGQM
ncbi:MAG: hypothetical protein KKC85_04575 [Gammaproteobacteria bacterium]|nr:hypothetical protein [Gammaproteobacteria bacterium]MBU1443706.1 hypothetical protein [Gammaproteobacteria bacterium]MBU2285691.1 hypothetical protein [Gammaproteobacteria bacterium]